MFPRNVSLFRFSPAVAADLARLPEALENHRLRDVGPLEFATHGFVGPTSAANDAPLTISLPGVTGFAVGGQQRDLKAVVVNEAVAKRIKTIADEEGRTVGGRERKRIKEDLITTLLPRAFVVGSRMAGYVATAAGWLVLDTASRKGAEQALTQLREALGSFPAVPLALKEGPRVLLTDWLANNTLPAGLCLGDEAELRDPTTASGAIARCRRQDLDTEEMKEHLRGGKQVYRLGLVFDDRISFVLGDDLVLRKLKFLDAVLDELSDSEHDGESEMQARFALMTGELERLLGKLDEWFGVARPVDGEG